MPALHLAAAIVFALVAVILGALGLASAIQARRERKKR